MVHLQDVSVAFSLLSAVIALFLFAIATKAYRRERERAYAFLAAAFLLFAVKSLVVAYAIQSGSIEHQQLELVDAVGDLGTILLIATPILLPRKR